MILGGFRSFDKDAELKYPRKLTNSEKDFYSQDKLHLFDLKTNAFRPLTEGSFHHDCNEGPTCAPIVNKNYLYFFGISDITAVNLQTGEIATLLDQGIKKVKEMPNLTPLQRRFIKRRLEKEKENNNDDEDYGDSGDEDGEGADNADKKNPRNVKKF